MSRARDDGAIALARFGVSWAAAFEAWLVETHFVSERPDPFGAWPEALAWGLWVPTVVVLVTAMIVLSARALWNVPVRAVSAASAAGTAAPFALGGVALHFGPRADAVVTYLFGFVASFAALCVYLGVDVLTTDRGAPPPGR